MKPLNQGEALALREQTEREVAALRRRFATTAPFVDFQPRFDPGTERRPDLAPVYEVFERAFRAWHGEGRPVVALVSAPPQIGKTKAGQASFAAMLARDPSMFLAYVTYQSGLALTKSRDIRDMALRAGVEVRSDSSAVERWQTTAGGGLLARGRDAGLTGHSGLAIVWADDLYSGRAEAESTAISTSINEMISGVIFTRRQPRTSIVLSFTRWTTTDAIAHVRSLLDGRAESLGLDLMVVNLPCVDVETGEALITFGGRDRRYYEAQRAIVTEHDWWSLYMGQPRPREGKLFRGSHVYTQRPGRMSIAIAMDLAYSAKTSADWSVALVGGRDLDQPPGERPRVYLLDHERARCTVEEWFTVRLRALIARYPGAPIYMRTGGQEAAVLETASRAHGVYVHHEPTRGDKLGNALVPADDWNEGRVLVPSGAEWASGFTSRMLDLSGKGDEVDDEMDALVTLHKRLTEGVVVGTMAVPAGHVAAARGGWM